MTEKEAIEQINNKINYLEKVKTYGNFNEILTALEMANKALEKQIPVERHHTRVRQVVNYMRESVCPKCLKIIITNELNYPKYCCWCGQAIDWGNDNDV